MIFRKIRRREKQLTVEECHEILEKAEYGTLATMGADGYPYAVTVNYVFLGGNIYFHCATVGHKLDNIEHCSNVSFNVVTDVWVIPLVYQRESNDTKESFNGFDTNFNSVIIFGEAEEVFEEEKKDGLEAFLKKFLNDDDYKKYKGEGIDYIKKSMGKTKLVKIKIAQLTGKRGVRDNMGIQGKQ